MSDYSHSVAAYLYFHLSESMPGPVTDRDGNIQVEADNELIQRWSEGQDQANIDIDRVSRFVSETEQLLFDLENLQLDQDQPVAAQYMSLFYEAAKRTFDYDKSKIRTYFQWLYLVVFEKPDGPRWGEFVEIYGVKNFVDLVNSRFQNLF